MDKRDYSTETSVPGKESAANAMEASMIGVSDGSEAKQLGGIGFEQVHWIENRTWFDAGTERGCCPNSKQIYNHRYVDIEYRCCSDLLEELLPLQPIHGLSIESFLEMFSQDSNPHTNVPFSGDSLAEQHFLGIFCCAWCLVKGDEIWLADQTR